MTLEDAVPVLRVASVAKSMVWYQKTLGFTGNSVGPPSDPVFAIVEREGVELMLQKSRPGIAPPRGAGGPRGGEAGWDVYLRIDDLEAFRNAVLAAGAHASPIVEREYGCRECVLTDPDGHVVVLSECG